MIKFTKNSNGNIEMTSQQFDQIVDLYEKAMMKLEEKTKNKKTAEQQSAEIELYVDKINELNETIVQLKKKIYNKQNAVSLDDVLTSLLSTGGRI